MTVQEIKHAMQGEWVSVAPEVRPSSIKSSDGSIKPFYLSRAFTYGPDDGFELTILNLADPYGKVTLAKLFITRIRREFHYFRSKLPEKTVFVSKTFAAVARFSQT